MAKRQSDKRRVEPEFVEPKIKDPAERRKIAERTLGRVKSSASIDFVRSIRGRR